MKPQSKILFFFLALMLAVNLACTTFAAAPTSTNTPPPTTTATLKPTSTPEPTATAVPPTWTAVPVKLPVTNEQYEVKVITYRFLDIVYTIVTGGAWEFSPKPGYIFLELGVMVKQLQEGKSANVSWEDVYIIDKNNHAWYPNFAGSYEPKKANEQVNPVTLQFDEIDNLENIEFENTVYLRVIWAVIDAKPASYLFGFDTSPLIEIPRK